LVNYIAGRSKRTFKKWGKFIENIISVIDGIAFQTNILALNAAVEAARAGEQGSDLTLLQEKYVT
jgi:methyl-accepting chemotaxis protein